MKTIILLSLAIFYGTTSSFANCDDTNNKVHVTSAEEGIIVKLLNKKGFWLVADEREAQYLASENCSYHRVTCENYNSRPRCSGTTYTNSSRTRRGESSNGTWDSHGRSCNASFTSCSPHTVLDDCTVTITHIATGKSVSYSNDKNFLGFVGWRGFDMPVCGNLGIETADVP